MAGFNCDYMAIDWQGFNWVRYEYCHVVEGGLTIGARREVRRIQKTEQGRCRDSDPKSYVRYVIGDREWICVLN